MLNAGMIFQKVLLCLRPVKTRPASGVSRLSDLIHIALSVF